MNGNILGKRLAMGNMPQPTPAEKIQANGVIGEIKLTPTKKPGRAMLEIPLYWPAEEHEKNRTKFTARVFVNPDWFDENFDPSQLEENEAIQYNINMQGKVMKLLKAVFGDDGEGSFEDLNGQIVGFSTKPRSDDVTQLEISTFYPMKEVE